MGRRGRRPCSVGPPGRLYARGWRAHSESLGLHQPDHGSASLADGDSGFDKADIVNQYLKTNSFAVTVAQGPLTSYLNTHPGVVPGAGIRTQLAGLIGDSGSGRKASDDGIRLFLAAHVTQTQLGPSELILTVTAPNPGVLGDVRHALRHRLARLWC